MFVECPRGGTRHTFIFVTIVTVYTVPTNGTYSYQWYLPMTEDCSGTTCEEVPRGARMAPSEQRGGD